MGDRPMVRESFWSEKGVPILDQSIPGRGVAFRVAAEASRDERIVYYSPDGNEDPADIERLDDLIIAGNDLAIASRFAVGSVNEETDVLRPRARVNQSLTWIANKLFNHGPLSPTPSTDFVRCAVARFWTWTHRSNDSRSNTKFRFVPCVDDGGLQNFPPLKVNVQVENPKRFHGRWAKIISRC